MFEVLIKTFLRPNCLYRLLDSLWTFYPGVKVRVCDDGCGVFSRNGFTLHKLPFYSGLAVGKNYLVSKCETDYFVLMDDDFVVTEETDIYKLLDVIQSADDIAVVAGRIREKDGTIRKGMGHLEVNYDEKEGRTLTRYYYGEKAPRHTINGVECIPCRMTPQLLVGSKKLWVKHNIKWRDELKRCEHYAFFLDLPPQLRCYVVPDVIVSHFPERPADYQKFKGNDLYKRMTGERKLIFRDLYE